MPPTTAAHYCRDIFSELTPFIPPGWSPQEVLSAKDVLVGHAPDRLKPLFTTFLVYLANVATQTQTIPEILDYREAVLPGVITQFVGDKLPLVLLPLEVDKLPAATKARVTLLDLGWNNFMAEDLAIIVDAVNKLPATAVRPEHLPWSPNALAAIDARILTTPAHTHTQRKLTISLRNNRLYNCVTQLRDLLRHPAVKFVDVSLNPVASIDSKDEILTLPQVELGRLIFLQPRHLSDSVLDIMSNGEQPLRAIIKNAHTTYFASDEFGYLNSTEH